MALGAALANTSKYSEALSQLERALELQPTHVNAKRYLEATKAKVRDTLGPLADAMLRPHQHSNPSPAAPGTAFAACTQKLLKFACMQVVETSLSASMSLFSMSLSSLSLFSMFLSSVYLFAVSLRLRRMYARMSLYVCMHICLSHLCLCTECVCVSVAAAPGAGGQGKESDGRGCGLEAGALDARSSLSLDARNSLSLQLQVFLLQLPHLASSEAAHLASPQPRPLTLTILSDLSLDLSIFLSLAELNQGSINQGWLRQDCPTILAFRSMCVCGVCL